MTRLEHRRYARRRQAGPWAGLKVELRRQTLDANGGLCGENEGVVGVTAMARWRTKKMVVPIGEDGQGLSGVCVREYI